MFGRVFTDRYQQRWAGVAPLSIGAAKLAYARVGQTLDVLPGRPLTTPAASIRRYSRMDRGNRWPTSRRDSPARDAWCHLHQ